MSNSEKAIVREYYNEAGEVAKFDTVMELYYIEGRNYTGDRPGDEWPIPYRRDEIEDNPEWFKKET